MDKKNEIQRETNKFPNIHINDEVSWNSHLGRWPQSPHYFTHNTSPLTSALESLFGKGKCTIKYNASWLFQSREEKNTPDS